MVPYVVELLKNVFHLITTKRNQPKRSNNVVLDRVNKKNKCDMGEILFYF